MKQDKNLSDIVNTIKDEGPSSYADKDLPEERKKKEAGRKEDGNKVTSEPETEQRHSKGHGLGYWLTLGIAIAVIGLGAVLGIRHYFPGFPKSTDTVGAGMPLDVSNGDQQVGATGLRALQARQTEIEARLNELTDNLAGTTESSNKRWIANEAALGQIRERQDQELNSMSQTIASLRQQLQQVQAQTVGGHSDLAVVQSTKQQTVQTRPEPDVQGTDQQAAQQKIPNTTPPDGQESTPDITKQVVQYSTTEGTPQAGRAVAREDAQETIAQDDRGAARKTVQQIDTDPLNVEEWVVNLALLTKQSSANRLMDELKHMSVTGQRTVITIRGRQMYRIRALGFPTKVEAQSYADRIGDKLGIHDAWVSRR